MVRITYLTVFITITVLVLYSAKLYISVKGTVPDINFKLKIEYIENATDSLKNVKNAIKISQAIDHGPGECNAIRILGNNLPQNNTTWQQAQAYAPYNFYSIVDAYSNFLGIPSNLFYLKLERGNADQAIANLLGVQVSTMPKINSKASRIDFLQSSKYEIKNNRTITSVGSAFPYLSLYYDEIANNNKTFHLTEGENTVNIKSTSVLPYYMLECHSSKVAILAISQYDLDKQGFVGRLSKNIQELKSNHAINKFVVISSAIGTKTNADIINKIPDIDVMLYQYGVDKNIATGIQSTLSSHYRLINHRQGISVMIGSLGGSYSKLIKADIDFNQYGQIVYENISRETVKSINYNKPNLNMRNPSYSITVTRKLNGIYHSIKQIIDTKSQLIVGSIPSDINHNPQVLGQFVANSYLQAGLKAINSIPSLKHFKHYPKIGLVSSSSLGKNICKNNVQGPSCLVSLMNIETVIPVNEAISITLLDNTQLRALIKNRNVIQSNMRQIDINKSGKTAVIANQDLFTNFNVANTPITKYTENGAMSNWTTQNSVYRLVLNLVL